ncbi:alanine racemase [Nitratireductor aquimarinus]|uniref:Alanine racemase n=1 Tax=Nitratireductor aquimarinus TaxID=889300 RepID=A0ABU4AH87_9HYPH|nr:alanine racemase [Nitratireductor aquimarinus]MDV6225608.1 alanine racemase [Nitratireductor aquimarinus]
MSDATLTTASDPVIDDRVRGFPAGHAALGLGAIGDQGWKPFDGAMSLPLISLDETAFANNVDLMMTYVREQGVEIAPHAKTPMSPAIAARLVEAGAWGVTVADIRQASVMLRAGFRRLILANEIGGPAAARRLARLVSAYPDAALSIFVDSREMMEALASAWSSSTDLPPLGLLVEQGAARGGLRSGEAALQLADAILERETDTFRLAGVAAYEGAAATPDAAETALRISALVERTATLFSALRQRLGSERPMIVTAGGSVYFDMVVRGLKAVVAADQNAVLVLRSGAIFFHDHGIYERGLTGLDNRSGFVIGGKAVSAATGFRPALRVWAEVLSRPEPGLAVCGMGLRDVAADQGLPRPLAFYRDGARTALSKTVRVTALNDQHAFVSLGDGVDLRVGDVVEFGISHPCTCLDRHAILYGLDDDHRVVSAYLTSFG